MQDNKVNDLSNLQVFYISCIYINFNLSNRLKIKKFLTFITGLNIMFYILSKCIK